MNPTLTRLWLLLVALVFASFDVLADEPESADLVFADGLSAETIYERVLANRFESSVQMLEMISGE